MKGMSAPAPMRIDMLHEAIAARPDSADLIFQLAETFAEIGDDDGFAACFLRAFQLAPQIRPRLDLDATTELPVRAAKLARQARALLERGITPAPVISALAIAAALLGDRGEVARLVDYARFVRCLDLDPQATPTDGRRHADLIGELASNLKRVEKGAGKAGDGEYRFNVFAAGSPACAALGREIRRQVKRYIAALPSPIDHPFIASRPNAFSLEAWAVFSRGNDFFAPHIHPQAWLSGVYYVQQPRVAAKRGWLRLCAPAHFGVTAADGWGERQVEPVPGRLVLMPGYFYHATSPTLSDQARICVAFNVVPSDLSNATAR